MFRHLELETDHLIGAHRIGCGHEAGDTDAWQVRSVS